MDWLFNKLNKLKILNCEIFGVKNILFEHCNAIGINGYDGYIQYHDNKYLRTPYLVGLIPDERYTQMKIDDKIYIIDIGYSTIKHSQNLFMREHYNYMKYISKGCLSNFYRIYGNVQNVKNL